MRLYPAIDLKAGECVRLQRGDMAQATVYATDPAAQARTFQDQGAEHLHVVDLDGAFAGHPVNAHAVAAILAAITIPLQLGGGIRDMPGLTSWIEAGVARVILGSAALKSPQLVHDACKAFPNQIAVGIDARNGMVAAEGWAETSMISAPELARRFQGAGVAALIYTDIARDGMLSGLNIPATLELAADIDIPVIASGGVGTLADLQALQHEAQAAPRARIDGVIVGRALYDGRIGLPEAIALLRG